MSQFATFLGTVSADGYVPRSFAHSQSQLVRLVSISGRRARGAIEAMYGGDPADALARKLAVAREVCTWTPLVRSSYRWNQWLDGEPRILTRGVDYDSARRLWESGRKAAAARGIRLVLIDRGESIELRSRVGPGTTLRRGDADR